jgi:parallel beta-helix repeat protein
MGIRGGTTSTISRCSVGLNGRGGIVVGESSTVSNCSVFENYQGTPQGNGIDVGDGSTVSGCSVRKNGPSGISCGSNCTVRENTCSNNGFNTPLGPVSGIVATGSHNRIEGNNCTDNFAMGVGGGAGIRVNGFANVIVRNTCSTGGGTGWIIAPNNICGPILDRSVPASAAINGSSAPSSLGSTDANANYTY